MKSEWFYVWFAYGLTWVSLAGYAAYLAGRVRSAAKAAGEEG